MAEVRAEGFYEDRVESFDDIKSEVLGCLSHFESKDRCATYYPIVNFRPEYIANLQPISDRQRRGYRQVLRQIEEMFARLTAKGSVRPDLQPSRAALPLVTLVNGIIEFGYWIAAPFPQPKRSR
jgi:hypothetical protein